MKLILGIAVIWLGLGLMLVLFGLPLSITGGWRQAAFLILFGPPIWILLEALGEALQKCFLPKAIDTWHPVLRICFMIFFVIAVSAAVIGAAYWIKNLK